MAGDEPAEADTSVVLEIAAHALACDLQADSGRVEYIGRTDADFMRRFDDAIVPTETVIPRPLG
ncbi:MAG: hypothetical protein ACRD0U_05400 [Acidimicrobiales bacterium]